MPIPTGSASQGILPFVGLDDELSALRDEVVRLKAENARLQRLLELTPQQARPPGPPWRDGFADDDAPPFLEGSRSDTAHGVALCSGPSGKAR